MRVRLPGPRWARIGLSVAVVAAVAGITLAITTLLGVTFQGSEPSTVAGAGTGRQPGVAICVQAVNTGAAAAASIEAGAKSRLEDVLPSVAQNPRWEAAGLAGGPTVIDVGCPSLPPQPAVAFDPPIRAVFGHTVSEPSKYGLFVFVLPRDQLLDFIGDSTSREAPQEVTCEDDVCSEVTTAVYISVEELQDTSFLTATVEHGLGLRLLAE
jgi:hypothetical protein